MESCLVQQQQDTCRALACYKKVRPPDQVWTAPHHSNVPLPSMPVHDAEECLTWFMLIEPALIINMQSPSATSTVMHMPLSGNLQ